MTKQTATFGLPPANGLYDPANEHDSCGVGFVCNIKGVASNQILRDAEHMNRCMDHRGGVGYEKNSGDGAGVLTALPHAFLTRVARAEFEADLPEPGSYGVGNIFLPNGAVERHRCETIIEEEIREAGQTLIGWRDLPVDPDGDFLQKTWAIYRRMSAPDTPPELTFEPFIVSLQNRIRAYDMHYAIYRYDWPALIGDLDKEILLIEGADDGFAGDVMALHKRLPGSQYAKVPGGSWQFYEKPAEHAEVIAEFLS